MEVQCSINRRHLSFCLTVTVEAGCEVLFSDLYLGASLTCLPTYRNSKVLVGEQVSMWVWLCVSVLAELGGLTSSFNITSNVCFLLGNSPASEFYMPTFRSTLFHLHRRVGTYPPLKMKRQCVPKRWHIKFRRRGITQKKAYNIQNTAKVWNQELQVILDSCDLSVKKKVTEGEVE